MTSLMDATGWFGQATNYLTIYVTGSYTITLMIWLLVIFLLMVAVYKVPVEWTLMSLTAIALVLMAFSHAWLIFGGTLFIIFAAFMARNWLTN